MEKKTYSDASKSLNTLKERKQMHQTLLFPFAAWLADLL